MLFRLYTVALDTVELASDCIQQLEQKLNLKHKLRFKRHTLKVIPHGTVAIPTAISFTKGKFTLCIFFWLRLRFYFHPNLTEWVFNLFICDVAVAYK